MVSSGYRKKCQRSFMGFRKESEKPIAGASKTMIGWWRYPPS